MPVVDKGHHSNEDLRLVAETIGKIVPIRSGLHYIKHSKRKQYTRDNYKENMQRQIGLLT